jgi:hypothetical protein
MGRLKGGVATDEGGHCTVSHGDVGPGWGAAQGKMILTFDRNER